jgi:hypothetical protein
MASKYGGMDVSMMSRMKELEEENRRLKKMYLEENLRAEIVSEAIEKKWSGHPDVRRWPSKQSRSAAFAFGWPARPLGSVSFVTATREGLMQRMKKLQLG